MGAMSMLKSCFYKLMAGSSGELRQCDDLRPHGLGFGVNP